MDHQLWSQLPTELLREVILFRATSSPSTARALRLVCRDTNVWVLSVLFSTLTLTSPHQISQFATTLVHKRKHQNPSTKSSPYTNPRPLTSYSIRSLILIVNSQLPYLETALAAVAPAFNRLRHLAIAAPNLASHAHWLRAHPIRPTHMIIPHFGAPQPVNFHEPVFHSVSHLYTSTLSNDHLSYPSSVADLPALTHLAVHTRIDLPDPDRARIARLVATTLAALIAPPSAAPAHTQGSGPRLLQSFVLVLDAENVHDPRIDAWRRALKPCLHDPRFVLLPCFRDLRAEWCTILASIDVGTETGAGPQQNVWDRARVWRDFEEAPAAAGFVGYSQMLEAAHKEREAYANANMNPSPSWGPGRSLNSGSSGVETEFMWEIDLVKKEGYFWKAELIMRHEADLLAMQL